MIDVRGYQNRLSASSLSNLLQDPLEFGVAVQGAEIAVLFDVGIGEAVVEDQLEVLQRVLSLAATFAKPETFANVGNLP